MYIYVILLIPFLKSLINLSKRSYLYLVPIAILILIRAWSFGVATGGNYFFGNGIIQGISYLAIIYLYYMMITFFINNILKAKNNKLILTFCIVLFKSCLYPLTIGYSYTPLNFFYINFASIFVIGLSLSIWL